MTRLLILIFVLPLSLYSQSLFVIDNLGIIHNVNIETCEVTELPQSSPFDDISFDLDGNLIGVINSSIYLVDTLTGSNISVIHEFNGSNHLGLTTSNEGIFYSVTVTGEVYSYNPAIGAEDLVIDFDVASGGGDLTFRYGVLLYAGAGNKISSYNLETNLELPLTTIEGIEGTLLGLSSNIVDCNQTTYACAFNGGAAGTSTIYELDFYTNESTEVCTIDIPVFGSAFKSEHMSSLDSITLNLPCDTIPNNVTIIDEPKISIFPNPVNHILHLPATNQTVFIMSIDGVKQNIQVPSNTNQIDVSGLQSGVYFLVLGHETVRFVKI